MYLPVNICVTMNIGHSAKQTNKQDNTDISLSAIIQPLGHSSFRLMSLFSSMTQLKMPYFICSHLLSLC